MIKKIILVLSLGLFTVFYGQTQSLQYFTIGADEFSNTDVYSVHYDDKNDILYAGTNTGVYAYKQNKFIPIESKQLQVGNSFFQLKADNNGEVYCSNLNGQIFKITNNELVLFYQLKGPYVNYSFTYFFDKKNNLIINNSNKIIHVKEQKTTKTLFHETKTTAHFKKKTFAFRSSYQLNDGSIIFGDLKSENYVLFENGRITSHKKSNFNGDQHIFFELGNTLYHYSREQFKSTYPSLLSPNDVVYKLNKNVVAVRNKVFGFHFIENQNGKPKASGLILEDKFISDITVNENNTMFLGTFKEGIIVVPNWQIIKYRTKLACTGITTSPLNDVYISNKNQIYKHDSGPIKLGEFSYNIDNLFYVRGDYPYNNKKINGIIHKSDTINWDKLMTVTNLKDMEEVSNDFLLFISHTSIQIVGKNQLDLPAHFAEKLEKNIYQIPLKFERGKSVTFIPEDNSIYFSTNKALYSKKWKSSFMDTLHYKGVMLQANDLANYKGNLIVGTEKTGVLFYKKNVFVKQLSSLNGLTDAAILKLVVKNNHLFILSNKGLQVYDLALNKFIGLGNKEGLISNKIIDFALSNDLLWILDTKGYYSIQYNKIRYSNPKAIGKIYLDSITVNNSPIDLNRKVRLKYSENDIRIFFDYRDIETFAETQLYYKLKGISDEWEAINPDINTLQFPALSPGEYILQIKAVYRGKVTESSPFEFRILQPFWFQWWFILLGVFTIVGLVSLYFFLRMRRNAKIQKIENEKQKLQSDIFETKLMAIRSQMNPHFVFNSLNSIQALVLKNDVKKSYDYIEMFSDLVRKTLSFSEKNYVSLNDEINFLEIYLKLESLRMKDEFKYTITNNISEDILVPSMLIQPFLENAIHHGLLHQIGHKNLSVSFSYDPEKEIAFCSIEDNGIGRMKATEINERQKYKYESFSLKATNERLRILSEQNDAQFSYEITDLYKEDGIASGTFVQVKYPFIY